MQLRPYQRAAIDALYRWFAEHSEGNPMLILPTGAGKSLIVAMLVREILETWPGQRVLMLTHVKELIEQNAKKLLQLWPRAPLGIYSAGLRRKDTFESVIFAGIQSVANKAMQLGRFDLILVDECFPAGTPIATSNGDVPIERIKPGEIINTALGPFPVINTCKRYATDLVEVRLSNGQTITCTENHPFFTGSGWVKAGALEFGQSVFRRKDVQALRQHILSLDQVESGRHCKELHSREALGKAKILLNILLQESQQPHEQEPGTGEAASHTSADTPQTNQARRQWPPFVAAAVGAIARAGRRVGIGSGRRDKDASRLGLSNLLQARSCQRGDEAGYRGRWKYSSRGAKAARQKEGADAGVIRVESVARLERNSATSVFNLHVSGHPSYYAYGVLVHNCHLIGHKAQGQYRAFLDAALAINPALRIVGLTATPFRTGSGSIMHGNDALFHDVAYQIGMLDLIDQGYLAPLASKRMAAQIDTSQVQTRNGEFVPGQLERAADNDTLTQAALDEVQQYGSDRKRWLVFCAGVAHAEHVAEALKARGIATGCVTGKTPPRHRDNLIAQYRSGQLQALTNANVLTTGFDAPETDLLVMLRPTQSPGLYVQMCGRGSRIAPGKDNCLVLDFAGNLQRHGPVDQVQAWTPRPKDGAGVAPVKTCPQCQRESATAIRQCPQCGYLFPFDTQHHDATAADGPILSTEAAPRIERHAVADVTYRRWPSRFGGPDTLRVDYRGPLMRIASEWICIEHTGYPRAKAASWWAQRAPTVPAPKSIDDALALCAHLAKPAAVDIDTRPKYPEITGYVWTHDDASSESAGDQNAA